MKKSTLEALLKAADKQVQDFVAAGELSANQQQAIAHAQKALIHAQLKQWAEAAEEYDAAIALCNPDSDAIEDKASIALNQYGKAIALFHLPERREETRAAIELALKLALEIGHTHLAAKGYFFLASLHREAGDILSALKANSRALRLDRKTESSTLTLSILRTRSSTYVLLGQLERARADLDRAYDLARRLGEIHLAYAIQLDRQTLKTLTTDETWVDSDRFLKTLLAEAQSAGADTVIGDINLYLALVAAEQEDWAASRDYAMTARQETLKASDIHRFARFLASSLAIAQACEALGDKVAAFDALIVAKKSLHTAEQEAAEEMVTLYLNTLPVRWGKEEFDRIFRIHQNRQRAKQHFQGIQITPKHPSTTG
ncbi:MAG: hypothetical protein AAGH67_09730 [Cyanobacteria bacterium P01_H01_bin.162]